MRLKEKKVDNNKKGQGDDYCLGNVQKKAANPAQYIHNNSILIRENLIVKGKFC